MGEAVHEILGGKVQLFRRPNSSSWQARASVSGKQFRHSTKQASLAQAKDVAEDWFLTLRGKASRGEIKSGKTFSYAADKFINEFEAITLGERSERYVKAHRDRLRVYLKPFFGARALQEISPGMVQEYRAWRIKTGSLKMPRHAPEGFKPTGDGKTPARSTLHQEIVCLRLVLKFANRNGWLPVLPDLAPAYRGSSKVSHRAWFSPAEYKSLYEASRDRAKNPKKERWRTASENLYDFILFMVNTGLRPDEALKIEYRDVEVVTEGNERILHIAVRGKRGVGYCKSMVGAVGAFQRLKKRNDGQPTASLFPILQRELFNTLLDELDLKKDREGRPRTFYSLRHTYISLRLMEGADIYQVAKNCRTSVEMIEKHYAAHIKNSLDAAAINVRRTPPKRRTKAPDTVPVAARPRTKSPWREG